MTGGGGRNRPYFPAVAPQICLILLAIQALPALFGHIFFKPFAVRLVTQSLALAANEPARSVL